MLNVEVNVSRAHRGVVGKRDVCGREKGRVEAAVKISRCPFVQDSSQAKSTAPRTHQSFCIKATLEDMSNSNDAIAMVETLLPL
jgi:hypothetical protein